MKAFDIEAAKKGARVVTRDGRPARIVCFDRKFPDFPILAIIGENEDCFFDYTTDGKLYKEEENESDLFLTTTHHEGWTNVYRFDDGKVGAMLVKPTEEEAKAIISKDKGLTYLATVKINWEE